MRLAKEALGRAQTRADDRVAARAAGAEDKQRGHVIGLLQSALDGLFPAMVRLGMCLADGQTPGIPQDLPSAAAWYRRAAEGGDIMGTMLLAQCLLSGRGVDVDLTESFDLYLDAAETGNAAAQYCVATYYEEGCGVDADANESFAWMMRSADARDADAQFDIGRYFNDGVGTDVDVDAAVKWWGRAAEQGHSGAMVALGDYYLGGHSSGHAMAFDYYTRAAAARNPDDAAHFSLGVCYQHARGVDEDARKAAACFSLGAEAGHVDAMNALADCFERGYGVKLNEQEAAQWRALAEDFDDEDADGDGDEADVDDEDGEDEADEDEEGL